MTNRNSILTIVAIAIIVVVAYATYYHHDHKPAQDVQWLGCIVSGLPTTNGWAISGHTKFQLGIDDNGYVVWRPVQ